MPVMQGALRLHYDCAAMPRLRFENGKQQNQGRNSFALGAHCIGGSLCLSETRRRQAVLAHGSGRYADAAGRLLGALNAQGKRQCVGVRDVRVCPNWRCGDVRGVAQRVYTAPVPRRTVGKKRCSTTKFASVHRNHHHVRGLFFFFFRLEEEAPAVSRRARADAADGSLHGRNGNAWFSTLGRGVAAVQSKKRGTKRGAGLRLNSGYLTLRRTPERRDTSHICAPQNINRCVQMVAGRSTTCAKHRRSFTEIPKITLSQVEVTDCAYLISNQQPN